MLSAARARRGFLTLALAPLALVAQEGANPCEIRPWETTDNGVGAEPGVVREFASGITMPAGCHRNGKVWVPRLLLNVTRTGGSSDMNVRVSIRDVETAGDAAQLPGKGRTTPNPKTLPDVPTFPSAGTYEVDTGLSSNVNINEILRDANFFVSVDMDGDDTANQFLSTDEQGPQDQDCFTGVDGETPVDPCTTGNPDISGTGQGATGYTFYGRYAGGEAVDGREPLAANWAARYLAPDTEGGPYPVGGTVDLRVRESVGGPVICEFFDIPDDFEFVCSMTAPQLALLADGRIVVELTGGGPTRSVRMLPADLFIFADGFESGDTSVWSSTVQ